MLISVVIPVFNAQEYIENTVDSVINQEYKNWELIIIDDCSTDDSLSIVETKYKSNKKIEIIKLERNSGGPAKPRNIGIKNSNGDFIAFLDQDDIWDNGKLRICCNSICDNVDFIYHDMRVVAENDYSVKQKILSSRQLEQPVLIDLLINDNAILNSSAMVRRSLLVKIGDINESKKMMASEDYNTWLRIAKITDNFLYIPKVLGSCLIHSGSASSKDMYDSAMFSSKEFLSCISLNQRKAIKIKRTYARVRYKYCNDERGRYIIILLFYCIKHGGVKIKAKSLYMLLNTILISAYRGWRT
jgi:glycosyltransferase involved in cell wall biosynthesis